MPPRRPLPDQCLISVFKALTPNDQLKASVMSPRCAILVRAANRPMKTLIITAGYVEKWDHWLLNHKIDRFSLASKPSMKQLADIPGESLPDDGDYPIARISKWNILQMSSTSQLFDNTAIDQIVTIFSAVTDLKFVTKYSELFDRLVSLLQHPDWQGQLTSLMVNGTACIRYHLALRLVAVINSLPSLQHLALEWDTSVTQPDLAILAQLQVCVFYSNHQDAFLRSLERNATGNDRLQVHLLFDDTETLFTLSQPLHSRIVRWESFHLRFHNLERVPLLCSQFRSLISFTFPDIVPTEVDQLFANLSTLPLLVHLEIELNFRKKSKRLPRPPGLEYLRQPQRRQLNFLRALDLDLYIAEHSQIRELNLQRTMPHLKTIYIKRFSCESCNFTLSLDHSNLPPFSSVPSARDCLYSFLFILHPGVPPKRIILKVGDGERISAEELLLLLDQSQSPPVSAD